MIKKKDLVPGQKYFLFNRDTEDITEAFFVEEVEGYFGTDLYFSLETGYSEFRFNLLSLIFKTKELAVKSLIKEYKQKIKELEAQL